MALCANFKLASYMKIPIQRLFLAALAASLVASGAARAAIQLSSTRVIMTEGQQHVSVFAKNLSSAPYVVQAWIDGAAEEMDTPFFITPRSEEHTSELQSLMRISYAVFFLYYTLFFFSSLLLFPNSSFFFLSLYIFLYLFFISFL